MYDDDDWSDEAIAARAKQEAKRRRKHDAKQWRKLMKMMPTGPAGMPGPTGAMGTRGEPGEHGVCQCVERVAQLEKTVLMLQKHSFKHRAVVHKPGRTRDA